MLIRRISLHLPAHMRATAGHDARAIAEALALRLAGTEAPSRLTLQAPALGRSGTVLGAALAGSLPKGGRHGR